MAAFQLTRRNFFVFAALLVALSFIVIAPLVPAISENIMIACIAVLAFCFFIAAICKRQEDTIFSAILLAIFVASYFIFPAQGSEQTLLAIRTCSITAFILLSAVLLIGPWSRFNRQILKLYWFRRHMGVTVFLLGLMHFRLVFKLYFDSSFEAAIQSLFTFYGFTAAFILFFMASTSWDWFQKHIKTKQWKMMNFLMFALYCGFTAWAIWVNVKNGQEIPTSFYIILGGFLLFWIVSSPWGLIGKFMKYINGWKQLHVLIYIAYFSIIAHSWDQLAQFNTPWLYLLWVGLPAFVVLSHAAGWYIKLTSEKRLKAADERAEKITINNFEYRHVGNVQDFKEGIGKRVFVGGIPVAVFKIKGEFFAWYAVCPHQKGPLERGKIEHGYVVCPWHQYQFGIKDGCGPPGYDDSTNLYPTEISDGKIFVSRVPVPKHKI